MAATKSRPLSPHLGIWRWGPNMLVSILHRVTGAGLAVVGLAALTWWLMAIAGGAESYSVFTAAATHWAGLIVLIGLTWAFFQHLLTGIRHLVTDSGAGLEINANKRSAVLSVVGSLVLTAALWVYILGVLK
jgi:succinate dehydrogenase / fumarate reductase cytochrome b subunit